MKLKDIYHSLKKLIDKSDYAEHDIAKLDIDLRAADISDLEILVANDKKIDLLVREQCPIR